MIVSLENDKTTRLIRYLRALTYSRWTIWWIAKTIGLTPIVHSWNTPIKRGRYTHLRSENIRFTFNAMKKKTCCENLAYFKKSTNITNINTLGNRNNYVK